VRGETLRVRKEDLKCKTCARFFVIDEKYLQDGEEHTDTRVGELDDVLVLEIGDREVTLCKANWFRLDTSSLVIECDTETPRINLDREWDTETEQLIEACEIVSQVVVVDLPFPSTFAREAVVLDRRFDTRKIPDPLAPESESEHEDNDDDGDSDMHDVSEDDGDDDMDEEDAAMDEED
jgi:hypothetical protein